MWMLLFKLVLVLPFHLQILRDIITTQLVRTDNLMICLRTLPSELATLNHEFKYLWSSFNFQAEISCLKKGREGILNYPMVLHKAFCLKGKSLDNVILHNSALLIVVFIVLIYATFFFWVFFTTFHSHLCLNRKEMERTESLSILQTEKQIVLEISSHIKIAREGDWIVWLPIQCSFKTTSLIL